MPSPEKLSVPMYGYLHEREPSLEDELHYTLADRDLSPALSRVISELEALPGGSHVLNLGCGDGVLERNTPNGRRFNFTSIDIEPAAIETLRETAFAQAGHEDQALVGSIAELAGMDELAHKQFDAAVSWRVLHGIPPEEHAQIIKNVRTLLKPGAAFYLSAASSDDWKAQALGSQYDPRGVNDCSGVMFRDFGIEREHAFPVHFFTIDEILELGFSNGFTPVEYDAFREPSGYKHLKHKENTYHVVKFEAS